MRKTISILLFLVIICNMFMLCSCGLIFTSKKYPEGYTGGFGISYGSDIEYYWVETYEEALEAISELESYGSTFTESAYFNYEGDLFDTKYCFVFSGKKHSVKEGKKPSERWADRVIIKTYAFFEDISIAELEYSYISDYDVLYFDPCSEFYRMHKEGEIVNLNSITYSWENERGSALLMQDDTLFFKVFRQKNNEYIEISDECVDAVIDSMLFIGEDDPRY